MSIKMSLSEYNKLTGNTDTSTKKKKNKYRNKRVNVDGVSYDSIAEYERHYILKLLERSGEISQLEYHKKKNNLVLQENPRIVYEPDFCYYDKNGTYVIEDVKGAQTKEFILKKKMIISKLETNEIEGMFILTKKVDKNNFKVVETYKSKKK